MEKIKHAFAEVFCFLFIVATIFGTIGLGFVVFEILSGNFDLFMPF